jgi:hypothetical protein
MEKNAAAAQRMKPLSDYHNGTSSCHSSPGKVLPGISQKGMDYIEYDEFSRFPSRGELVGYIL